MPTAFSAPETLIGRRVLLRRAQPTDAAAIFAEYAQDPEVTRYLTWRPHEGVNETEGFLAECVARWEAGTEFTWTVNLAGDEPAGAVGMVACRVCGHAANLGYVLARRLWGQGFMSEAARLVVAWAIEQPTVVRVWAVCDTANVASARVLEKAGMQREGILRRWMVHPNVSAEPRDCFVYARVR
jgi:RimJ/RimL family protein N-acetyltransferase